MPTVDATNPALTAKRACSCGEDRRLRRRSPPRPPYSAGHAMPAQPPSNSSRCHARPASKCSRSVVGRVEAGAHRGRVLREPRHAPRPGTRRRTAPAHPNRILDTCKGACQDPLVFHDPATFAARLPARHVPRAARRRSRLAPRSPHVEARLLGRSRATPTCSASRATPRRSATRRIPFLDAEMPEDGDGGCRSCSSARTRRCTPSCGS